MESTMTVKELIDVLQKLDPEMIVLVDGYEGGYDTPQAAERIPVIGPRETQWYYGDYTDCEHDDPSQITAFVLRR